jgi:polysaccharide export outer membrane protein
VEVGGLSPREAQDRVVEVLGKYLKTPQVVVSIQQFRSQRVMVTGQVAKPGYQPLTDVPLTLLAAISNAGGTAELRGHNDTRALGANNSGQANDAMEFPDLSHVILRRNDREYVIDVQKILRAGEVSRDVTLQDGDVVVVPPTRRGNVYVLGEVMRPALVEIRPEATDLAEVLLAAGGVNQLSANPRRIYVIRGDFAGPEIYQLNSKAPDALLLAQQFPMKSQDVVYVAEAPVGYWNRTLSQILPTLQGLLSTAVIANTVDTLNRNN